MALDFAIIGAQRAGTSWAHSRLSMHPQIDFPLGKEINFWNRFLELEARHPQMAPLYKARFGLRTFSQDDNLRLGDISPYYSTMDDTSIDRMYAQYPMVRTILIVRNPILRTYSARRFSVTRGRKGEHALTPRSVGKLFVEKNASPQSDYVRIIERWQAAALRANATPLDIVFYDDILTNPVGLLRQLSTIVGVEGEFYGLLPQSIIAQPMNSSRGEPFPENIYSTALSFYAPMIRRLSEITGRNLDGWLRPDAPSEYSSLC